MLYSLGASAVCNVYCLYSRWVKRCSGCQNICHKCSLLALHCFLTKKLEKKCYYFKTDRNLVYFFASSLYIAFSILKLFFLIFLTLKRRFSNKMFFFGIKKHNSHLVRVGQYLPSSETASRRGQYCPRLYAGLNCCQCSGHNAYKPK